MKKIFFLIGFVVITISSCKKPVTEPNSGIYRGSFFEIYNETDTNGQGVAILSLSKDGFGGVFQMSGDSITGAPYTHSGTYYIDSETHMTFNTDTVEGTGTNPHFILDTTYIYTFDDSHFSLEMSRDLWRYVYTLIRI